MIPGAFLAALLAASAKAPRVADVPRSASPAEVYYGAELPSPFLPVLPPTGAVTSSAAWVAAPASLVLLGPGGTPVHELGLGRFSSEDGALRREMRGDVSKGGRFAWHWQKLTVQDRSASTLVYLGSRGQLLERLDGADAPEGLPPAVLSADGTALLAALRVENSWTVTARAFTGRRLASVTKAHRVAALSVSADGLRALVAWAGLDQPLFVSLFDFSRDTRQDIPADGLPPGPWTLSPEGDLLADGRPVPRRP